ncbi:hypothetical protein SDC9_90963 [bioreactor metagenome]|uniref:Uncharacterized protein n=1 Tax=bioreactor metagenome TaxID=1076179 RepID=A0A644ZTS4_9ZZZZ
MARGAQRLFVLQIGQYGSAIAQRLQAALHLLELLSERQRLRVLRQRKAPQRVAALVVVQLQRAYAAMVKQTHRHAGLDGPGLRHAFRIAENETLWCKRQKAAFKAQIRGQVNLQRCQHVFICTEFCSQLLSGGSFQDAGSVHRMVVILHLDYFSALDTFKIHSVPLRALSMTNAAVLRHPFLTRRPPGRLTSIHFPRK